ncbi:unnamed protein product [Acanthoscelides obtectus]|nr:unnamed protein product [Acanthoscelides obtectus]CAK1645647.1 Transport and Golgi organization protein 2 homolog [Acanthoscelides obtectus]
MCILFVHVDPDPKEGQYRLVVATNRDEYYRRPAKSAYKDEETNIIGGVDMQEGREGGMWLGFRTKGIEEGKEKKHCVAILLNLAGEALENSHGRGFIVKDYLLSSMKPPDYIKEIEKDHNYSGYTFVAVELSQNEAVTYHHGNRPPVDSIYTGEHTLGFGNSPPYCPYAKVCKGRYKMLEILESGKQGDELVQELLNLLKDRTK